MSAPVRLADRDQWVLVEFSAHAADRFVERVRPSLARGAALEQLECISAHGVIRLGPPPWRLRAEAFLYLVIGDGEIGEFDSLWVEVQQERRALDDAARKRKQRRMVRVAFAESSRRRRRGPLPRRRCVSGRSRSRGRHCERHP